MFHSMVSFVRNGKHPDSSRCYLFVGRCLQQSLTFGVADYYFRCTFSSIYPTISLTILLVVLYFRDSPVMKSPDPVAAATQVSHIPGRRYLVTYTADSQLAVMLTLVTCC